MSLVGDFLCGTGGDEKRHFFFSTLLSAPPCVLSLSRPFPFLYLELSPAFPLRRNQRFQKNILENFVSSLLSVFVYFWSEKVLNSTM
jgi:hypothetical protein